MSRAAVQIRARVLDLPLRRAFTISRGSRSIAHNVVVEIEYEGIVGRGEGAPNARYGQSQERAVTALKNFESPSDARPFDIERILGAFLERSPVESAAACALELALWDWIGQKLQQPLHQILAIDPRTMPTSSWTISIDQPEGITDRLAEARDWPVFKVKLGGGIQDEATIDRLRAYTDRPFRVDANEAWSVDEALRKIPWLAARGCELIEQPLPAGRLDEMAQLKAESPLPLVADEDLVDLSSLNRLGESYHGVNVKLSKCGGVLAAVRLIHAAHERGLDVMVGCFVESSLGISAACHLAALARWADLDGAALLADDPFEGSSVQSGKIHLGTGPGLGVRARGER